MSRQWLCDGTSEPPHVIPIADSKAHVKLGICPCGARLNRDGVMVHNAYDGREFIESALAAQDRPATRN